MGIKRREILKFLGMSTGTVLLSQGTKALSYPFMVASKGKEIVKTTVKASQSWTFTPVKIPIPLTIEKLSDEQQKSNYNLRHFLTHPQSHM